jgi:hypothetical protein
VSVFGSVIGGPLLGGLYLPVQTHQAGWIHRRGLGISAHEIAAGRAAEAERVARAHLAATQQVMLSRSEAGIVTVSSISGHVGIPGLPQASYAASKMGLSGLTGDQGRGRASRSAARTTLARRLACSAGSLSSAPVSMRASCGAEIHHAASPMMRNTR